MARVQTRRTISINRETYERLKLAGATLSSSAAGYADRVLNDGMDEDGIGPSPYVRPAPQEPRRGRPPGSPTRARRRR